MAAIERRYALLGYEPVEEPSITEPDLLRVRIAVQGAWLSFADEQMDTSPEWATFFSTALDAQALALWSWDGEPRLTATLFDKGKKTGELSLPEHAKRTKTGKISLSLGTLSCLVGDGKKKSGLSVQFSPTDGNDEDGETVTYVSLDDAEPALCRAFALRDLFLDPLDDDARGFVLAFRSLGKAAHAERAEQAAKPAAAKGKGAKSEPAKEDPQHRMDHDARVYSVGWLAFDASPSDFPELLTRTAQPLTNLFLPLMGDTPWQIRRILRDEAESASIVPSGIVHALVEGDFVEIVRPGSTVIASVALMAEQGSFAIAWSVRSLKDEGRRRAMATSMEQIVLRACSDTRCFGALLSAQRVPVTAQNHVLAFEHLRGRTLAARRAPWQRTHVRSPGWRVLLPKKANYPEGAPPNNWTNVSTRAGTLLSSRDPEPFVMTPEAIDEIEKYLAPALGDVSALA